MAAHVVTVVGFAGAAVWGYFNFIKSRTYHPRLEMIVSGDLRWKGTQQFLVPRVTLRNIGKSKVALTQSGSGFRIWTAQESGKETGKLSWLNGETVFPVFEDHKWIEPGEMIFDELDIFALRSDAIAAKIQARLVVPLGWPRRKNSEWNCSAIVGPVVPPKENT